MVLIQGPERPGRGYLSCGPGGLWPHVERIPLWGKAVLCEWGVLREGGERLGVEGALLNHPREECRL